MEIRVVIHESFKIIALNILFRFFFIVHAEKGFLVRHSPIFFCSFTWFKVGGHLNTSLFNKIYVLLFLGTTSAQAWYASLIFWWLTFGLVLDSETPQRREMLPNLKTSSSNPNVADNPYRYIPNIWGLIWWADLTIFSSLQLLSWPGSIMFKEVSILPTKYPFDQKY